MTLNQNTKSVSLKDSGTACVQMFLWFKWTKCCKRSSGRLHKCWVLVKSDVSYCPHGCISWVILRLCIAVLMSVLWDSTGVLTASVEACGRVFPYDYMTYCSRLIAALMVMDRCKQKDKKTATNTMCKTLVHEVQRTVLKGNPWIQTTSKSTGLFLWHWHQVDPWFWMKRLDNYWMDSREIWLINPFSGWVVLILIHYLFKVASSK